MRRTIILFLVIVFALFFTTSVVKKMWSVYKAGGRLAREQATVDQLAKENEELKKSIDYAKSREFVEKEARDKLNLSLSGETVVVLPQVQATASSNTVLAKNVPNWQRWWQLFFD